MSNQVTIIGLISSEFTYDHSMYGEKYLRFTLTVERTSGTNDYIPVIISERLLSDYVVNTYVAVRGQFRSYKSDGKLILFVFATEIEEVKPDNYNEIYLEGIIYKPPVYRLTPYGREITDILLKVPRAYGKCDYIPCVAWSRSAKYVSELQVSTVIRVAGRVQSREYTKNDETKTAYEVSVNLVESV